MLVEEKLMKKRNPQTRMWDLPTRNLRHSHTKRKYERCWKKEYVIRKAGSEYEVNEAWELLMKCSVTAAETVCGKKII